MLFPIPSLRLLQFTFTPDFASIYDYTVRIAASNLRFTLRMKEIVRGVRIFHIYVIMINISVTDVNERKLMFV